MSHKFVRTLLFACLAVISVNLFGEAYGHPFQERQSASAEVKQWAIPGGYTEMPGARDKKTVGVAVLNVLNPDSDDAEKAIHEFMGHIPGVSMTITLNNKEPLYIFKFLKYLKDTGRKVDLLCIGGHAVSNEKTGEIYYINMGSGQAQLTPGSVDLVTMLQEIQRLAQSGENPARKKLLCDRLKLIREGSSALVPGAQLIVHSCYFGSDDAIGARTFLKMLGAAFLGVNGGTIYGPTHPIGSRIVGDDFIPESFPRAMLHGLVTRYQQVHNSIKSKKWLQVGDAFVSTNSFTKAPIAAGIIKPTCPDCDTYSASNALQTFKRSQPKVEQKVLQDNFTTTTLSVSDNAFDWKTVDKNGKTMTSRLEFTEPPPLIQQNKPFTLSGTLSGDTEMHDHWSIASWEKGFGFRGYGEDDGNDHIYLDHSKLSDSKTYVTPTNPSQRQREGMWLSVTCNCGANNVKKTWDYTLNEPVTGMMARTGAAGSSSSTATGTSASANKAVTNPTKSSKASSNTVTKSTKSDDYQFKRTGPFITQKEMVSGQKVTLGDNSITWTGLDLTQTKQVSCTVTYTPPPETLSIGDSFEVTVSAEGSEDVSPIGQFLSDMWLKPSAQPKLVSLRGGNCIPSVTTLYRVADYKKFLADFKKQNPAKASMITPAFEAKLPSLKLSMSGLTQVEVEWRYVRK